MSRPLRAAAALVVVAIATFVLLGVGQGHAGKQLPVSARAAAAAQKRLAKLGDEGKMGQAVFASAGCNACHTIGVSGYGGKLGPNLDAYLHGLPKPAIKAFILQPLTVRIPGFTHNLMPNNFGSRLSSPQLRALVAYLHAVAG